MEPLDLTLAPPRPPRAEIDGLMLLPRTIDKMRAKLPGGNPGVYFINGPVTGISGFLLQRLGVTEDEMLEAVADAKGDHDIVAWLGTKSDPNTWEALSNAIAHIQPKHSEDESFVRGVYAEVIADQPELKYLVDIIDADDRRMFGAVK